MNVNNETIHQFRAINSIVKQATGRENVSNIDMNHVTVAQNKQWMNMQASGDMVAFGTMASAPMKVIAQIKAVQSGEGDPSPSNVRPIQGFGSVAITVSPTPGEGGRVYGTAFPDPPGIVYGGALTINKDGSGTLTVDSKVILGEEITWGYNATYKYFTGSLSDIIATMTGDTPKLLCDRYKTIPTLTTSGWLDAKNLSIGQRNNNKSIIIKDLNYSNAVPFASAVNDMQIVYELATPITYTITAEQINSIIGENYVWSNTGEISIDVAVLQDTV